MCLHVQVVAVLASLLDHIAAGHLTRPECGAGDESTPSGASGARDGMPHVFRHSSWTHPCSPDKVVYLEFFHVMSNRLSAYIDSSNFSLFFWQSAVCLWKTVVLSLIDVVLFNRIDYSAAVFVALLFWISFCPTAKTATCEALFR